MINGWHLSSYFIRFQDKIRISHLESLIIEQCLINDGALITIAMTGQSHRRSERTDVLYGIDKNVNAIVEFINSSKCRYDVCADSKGPSYVIKIDALRQSYIEFVRRGGHIRFITEITKENLDYCKEIMKFVELCHIEGIKGIVRINENEYQSNMAVQESKLASILLRSALSAYYWS